MSDLARQLDFTAEQRQMILHTYAAGASPAEFAVLMEVAKARNLNPLTKQIWFVKLAGKWTFQVSIDGLRAIAQRSGLYAGQDAPVFQYDKQGGLVSCSVAVYRKDWTRAAVGVAFFKEFSTGQNLWASKPHVMISKVAEAIALRKAFSEDMSGLYGEGELDQSAVVAQAAPVRQLQMAPPPAAQPPPTEPVNPITGEIDDYSPEEMGEPSDAAEPPEEAPRIAFGKHSGKLWSEIPISYCQWLANGETTKPDTRALAQAEIARRGS